MTIYYGTATGFRTYHSARGRDVSAFNDDAAIVAKLTVGSEWIDAKWRDAFPGTKVGQRAQIREWPRYGGVDVNGYAIASDVPPTEIENATYEAAWRELQTAGALAVDWTPPKYDSASVAGAVSVRYSRFNDAGEAQTKFPIIDQILAVILTGCGADVSPLSGGSGRA